MNDTYLSPKEAQHTFGVTRGKLNELDNSGKVRVERTEGGHRRYSSNDLAKATSKRITDRGMLRELGSTGLSKWDDSAYREKINALKGRSGYNIFREMRLNDPVISAVFFALVNALRQASWRVKPASDKAADKKVAEFVEECIHDLSWSWADQLTFIVDPEMEQGFSYLETTYKYRRGNRTSRGGAQSLYDDNKIGWRKWAPRPAESLVEGDEWEYDANGGILGANQDNGNSKVFLPIEKCLLFRTTVHPANSPWGVPIHRSMYTSWYYSQNIAEIEGIGVERDLAGIPVIYLGSDCTMTGENSDYTLAKDLVVNIRNDEQVGVVIPKPKMGTGSNPGEGMLLELLNTGGSKEFDTTAIIERYDKRKAVSVLAQFILLGMDAVGSFALSKNQSDLFVLAARAWLNDIAGVINLHAIPKLIQFNVFPRTTGYPELVPGSLGIPDLSAVAEYVNKLVQSNVLTPDEELERHLRQLGGLPVMSANVYTLPQETRQGPLQQPQGQPGRQSQQPKETQPKESKPKEEKPTTVKKAAHQGYRITDETDKKLDELWNSFIDKAEEIEKEQSNDRDALLAALLLVLTHDVENVIKDGFVSVWVAVNGDTAGAGTVIDSLTVEYMGYFRNFMDEVKTQLLGVGMIANIRAMLGNYTARLRSYAGGVWRLYNEAKIWLAPRDSIWEWRGPNDEKTCIDCGEEIMAGKRPLWQITKRPGAVICLSHCRCELMRVS